MRLILGDCEEQLKNLETDSVDSIVTDPPYGISFQHSAWDHNVPPAAIWIEALRVLRPGAHLLSFGSTRTYHRMVVEIEDAGFEIRDQLQWLYSGMPKAQNLKPAHEPIVLARKPGKSALNIDAGRIGEHARWPSNVLLDEEAAAILDAQTGVLVSKYGVQTTSSEGKASMFGLGQIGNANQFIGDKGGASRFFYCAKASKLERGEGNTHPTVKPLKLMDYLIKLVTPPGGIVLDPFMGSGTTGVAAKQAGFTFIGIEKEESYLEIAKKRIA